MEVTRYPVLLNLKVPWLTKAFYYSFIVCLILLLLFGIYMLPSKHAGSEMKAAYFVLTTSELEKLLFVMGWVGTPTFFILYKYIRHKREALLTLFSDKIEVDNHKTITTYSISEITHIACNDALTKDGYPKGKLSIDFKDKAGNFISMTLVDYSHSEEIMNTVLNYENIKFDVTNFTSNPEVLDMEGM